MKRIEGSALVACWLIGSSILVFGRLVSQLTPILAHPAAWRAVAGPLVIALLNVFAARQLIRVRRGFRLAGALLAFQVVSVSAGPLAYRLDAGPFVRFGVAANGVIAAMGSDANLLLITGSENRVPSGLAINVLALAALLVLIAAQRASADAEFAHAASS